MSQLDIVMKKLWDIDDQSAWNGWTAKDIAAVFTSDQIESAFASFVSKCPDELEDGTSHSSEAIADLQKFRQTDQFRKELREYTEDCENIGVWSENK